MAAPRTVEAFSAQWYITSRSPPPTQVNNEEPAVRVKWSVSITCIGRMVLGQGLSYGFDFQSAHSFVNAPSLPLTFLLHLESPEPPLHLLSSPTLPSHSIYTAA